MLSHHGGIGEPGDDADECGFEETAARTLKMCLAGRNIDCSVDGIVEVMQGAAEELAASEQYEQPFLDDCEPCARELIILDVCRRVYPRHTKIILSFFRPLGYRIRNMANARCC